MARESVLAATYTEYRDTERHQSTSGLLSCSLHQTVQPLDSRIFSIAGWFESTMKRLVLHRACLLGEPLKEAGEVE
jgi:hypothetical protein